MHGRVTHGRVTAGLTPPPPPAAPLPTLHPPPVTSGMDVLRKLETLETRKEGIFVMPKERISITGSYWYVEGQPFTLRAGPSPAGLRGSGSKVAGLPGLQSEYNPGGTLGLGSSVCDKLEDLLDKERSRSAWCSEELQRVRHKCLPGY